MLKATITKALSNQVNAEFYSAYLYLMMSAHCDRLGFKGFANWLYIQAHEESAHAKHIYQHILERGEAVQFSAIALPEGSWNNLISIFEHVLRHEQHVTELINSIATLAMKENDHATYNFIQWYINEQVEEESGADEILQKLKFIGDNTGMLYNMDTEMAARVFVDPFAAATN